MGDDDPGNLNRISVIQSWENDDAPEHVKEYKAKGEAGWDQEETFRASLQAHGAWSNRIGQHIDEGKYSTHDSETDTSSVCHQFSVN